MPKKPIARRDVRVSIDAVTHEKQVTILDPVQLAFERVVQAIDRERKALSNGDAIRLVDRVQEELTKMVPFTDGDGASGE